MEQQTGNSIVTFHGAGTISSGTSYISSQIQQRYETAIGHIRGHTHGRKHHVSVLLAPIHGFFEGVNRHSLWVIDGTNPLPSYHGLRNPSFY